jgi:Ca-activated chloride channel homolog
VSFHFENPSAFQLFGLVIMLLAFAWWRLERTRKMLTAAFGAARLSFLSQTVSWSRRKVKIVLQCLALAILIFSLARPQSGESRIKAKSEGLELAIAVDVSTSMMAEDVRPSRLGLVQQELSRLLNLLGGDKVSLTAFAGSAVLLSPLTTDKSALKMYIDSLSPYTVSTQGTEFKKALAEADGSLKRGGLDNEGEAAVTKVILIISDGENHDEKDLDIANKIAASGIRIYTLAVGTEKGAPIPLRNEHGENEGFKRDKNNQVVISQSTGASLQKLAEVGHGTFRYLTFGGDAIKALLADLSQLQRTQFDTTDITNYHEDYQMFLVWGIVIALIELLLGERKGVGRIWRGRFEISRR